MYDERASWLTPQKINEKLRVFGVFKIFFQRSNLTFSSRGNLTFVCFTNEISSFEVPFTSKIYSLAFTNLSTELTKPRRDKEILCYGIWSILLPHYLDQYLPIGGLQWTLQLHKWVNQSTNQSTPNKSQTLWEVGGISNKNYAHPFLFISQKLNVFLTLDQR